MHVGCVWRGVGRRGQLRGQLPEGPAQVSAVWGRGWQWGQFSPGQGGGAEAGSLKSGATLALRPGTGSERGEGGWGAGPGAPCWEGALRVRRGLDLRSPRASCCPWSVPPEPSPGAGLGALLQLGQDRGGAWSCPESWPDRFTE